jgi:hypothetical protein
MLMAALPAPPRATSASVRSGHGRVLALLPSTCSSDGGAADGVDGRTAFRACVAVHADGALTAWSGARPRGGGAPQLVRHDEPALVTRALSAAVGGTAGSRQLALLATTHATAMLVDADTALGSGDPVSGRGDSGISSTAPIAGVLGSAALPRPATALDWDAANEQVVLGDGAGTVAFLPLRTLLEASTASGQPLLQPWAPSWLSHVTGAVGTAAGPAVSSVRLWPFSAHTCAAAA